MATFTSDGTILSVSAGPPATYDQAGYEALTFTAIGEVVDFGSGDSTYGVASYKPLATRTTVKRKGSVEHSDMTFQMAKDIADAGQVILQTGLDGAEDDTEHSFKIALADGTVQYTTGLITSFSTEIGGADSIVFASLTIARSQGVVEV